MILRARNFTCEYDSEASDPYPEVEEKKRIPKEDDSDYDEVQLINNMYPNGVGGERPELTKSMFIKRLLTKRLFKGIKKGILKKYSNEYLQQHHEMISNQWIIRHLDNKRINWELLIIILAIYNAF